MIVRSEGNLLVVQVTHPEGLLTISSPSISKEMWMESKMVKIPLEWDVYTVRYAVREPYNIYVTYTDTHVHVPKNGPGRLGRRLARLRGAKTTEEQIRMFEQIKEQLYESNKKG